MDNLNRSDAWARWRATMDSLFAQWPIIMVVTQGQRMILQAQRVAASQHADNDNEEPRR